MTDEELLARLAEAIASVSITIGPNSLALLRKGHTLGLDGGEIHAMALSALAVVRPEIDRLRAEARPGCPDPIECDHEAELGQLREELERLRDKLCHAECRPLDGCDCGQGRAETVRRGRRATAPPVAPDRGPSA